jgi:predicted secreted protein
MREGEELKAPRHASAAAARDDHVTTRDIVPTTTIGNYIIGLYYKVTKVKRFYYWIDI